MGRLAGWALYRRAVSALAVGALVLGAATPGVAEIDRPDPPLDLLAGGFIDATDHLFADDITWLADSGITKGCNPPENDRFCPDDVVTRGQMAAFLRRALPGMEELSFVPGFEDTATSTFEADIYWAASTGITKGCNPPVNDEFCPDDPVTRGQMAAFLVRGLGISDGETQFSFVDDDASVFERDIELLADAGITRGCNPPANDEFCPDEAVTRGQMAAFLRRSLAPGDGPSPGGDEESSGGSTSAPDDGSAKIDVPPESTYQSEEPEGSSEGSTGELPSGEIDLPIIDASAEVVGNPNLTSDDLEVPDDASQTAPGLDVLEFDGPQGDLNLQIDRRQGVFTYSDRNYVQASSTVQAVGVLYYWYGNGQFAGICSGTLMSRNIVLTAAHCITDKNGVDFGRWRFFPNYYPGRASTYYEGNLAYRWPAYKSLTAARSGYAKILDYGLVKLNPVNGQYPGDKYGSWPVWMSPPLTPSSAYALERSGPWDQRRYLVGYPGEGWFAKNYAYPWFCDSSDGGYFHWGSGFWSMGAGCQASGGMSGGPIFAIRNNRWYIVSVVSTVEYTVGCGVSNWPGTYPCYPNSVGVQNRFSVGLNAWGPALLNTSGGDGFDDLWRIANS